MSKIFLAIFLLSACVTTPPGNKEVTAAFAKTSVEKSSVSDSGENIIFPSEEEMIAAPISKFSGNVEKAEKAVAGEVLRVVEKACGKIPPKDQKFVEFLIRHDETYAYAMARVDNSICQKGITHKDDPFKLEELDYPYKPKN